MVVELVGLPGVGKSFLCRSLKDVYAGEGHVPVRIAVESEAALPFRAPRALGGKLWRAARFAAVHVGTTGRLVLAIRSGEGILGLLRCGRPSKLVNLLSEADRSARASPSEIRISEQGVLQAVWSLEMRSGQPLHAELVRLLARWLPEVVVLVEADRAEYESRLRRRERGRSHFDRLGSERLPEAIERGLRGTREILEVWALHVPGAERLDFWNGGDARAEDIAEWVNGLSAVRPFASRSAPEEGVGRGGGDRRCA